MVVPHCSVPQSVLRETAPVLVETIFDIARIGIICVSPTELILMCVGSRTSQKNEENGRLVIEMLLGDPHPSRSEGAQQPDARPGLPPQGWSPRGFGMVLTFAAFFGLLSTSSPVWQTPGAPSFEPWMGSC